MQMYSLMSRRRVCSLRCNATAVGRSRTAVCKHVSWPVGVVEAERVKAVIYCPRCVASRQVDRVDRRKVRVLYGTYIVQKAMQSVNRGSSLFALSLSSPPPGVGLT